MNDDDSAIWEPRARNKVTEDAAHFSVGSVVSSRATPREAAWAVTAFGLSSACLAPAAVPGSVLVSPGAVVAARPSSR